MNVEETTCPYCGETIKAVARKCKHCGEWFSADVEPKPADRGRPTTPRRTTSTANTELSSLNSPEIASLLHALVDRSLVARDHVTGRYRLLESVRQYARDRLVESEEAPARRALHRDFYLTLAELASPRILEGDGPSWIDKLDREYDNFRAVLEGVADEGISEGLRICIALTGFWEWRSHISEARCHLTRVLELSATSEPTVEKGRALGCASRLAGEQGDYAAARSYGDEGLAISQELDDDTGKRICLQSSAWSAIHEGDYAFARSRLEEALVWAETLGDDRLKASLLHWSGVTAESEGHYALARQLYEQTYAMCEETQTPWRAAWALHGLGYIACMEGDLARARALLSESLTEFRARAEPLGIIRSLDRFGTLAIAEGELSRAARLIAAAQVHRLASGWLPGATEKQELERDLIEIRRSLGEAEFSAAWAEGRTLTLDQAAAYAQAVIRASPPAG